MDPHIHTYTRPHACMHSPHAQAEQDPSANSSSRLGPARRLPRSQSSLYSRTLSRQTSPPRKASMHEANGSGSLRSYPSVKTTSPFAAAATRDPLHSHSPHSPENARAHAHACGLQQQSSGGKRASMSGVDDSHSTASDTSPKRGVLRDTCRCVGAVLDMC